MRKWVQSLDAVLRGDATRPAQLRNGNLDVPIGGLLALITLLGASYGVCMGCFALFNRENSQALQMLSSTIKVPALFLLTLVVTAPSLYVFNALVGSRLGGLALLRLLLASLGVTLAVLASIGPIVAFFSLTTTSYAFMNILNVVVFASAGTLGLGFLMQTLHRLTQSDAPVENVNAPTEAIDRLPEASHRKVRLVFRCWVMVFGLVGAQMSWVLRPFIGNPDRPFEWFRLRESNFFASVRQTLSVLFE